MWMQIDKEFLNLDQVYRVRFGKAWRKDGVSVMTAEIEGFVQGELQVMSRYRGTEAEMLHTILERQSEYAAQVAPVESKTQSPAVSKSETNTVFDL